MRGEEFDLGLSLAVTHRGAVLAACHRGAHAT